MNRPSVPTASLLALLLASGSLLHSAPAHADLCALDQRPAATLLMPYFEVDLAAQAGQGQNTRIWVRNASTRPKLTNITMWTTWGVPAFSFHVYLAAFGTERIDLGALLLTGRLPRTGSGVTPVGDFDSVGTPLTFPNCNATSTPGAPPVYTDLSVGAQTDLRARFSGKAATGGQCFGANLGDDVARGYVTVDDVNECVSLLSPADPGYLFAGGNGVATNQNVLLGGVEYIHPGQNFAQAMPAAALEANDTAFVPGDPTFYGRYVAYLGSDGREPLPFSWSFNFDGVTDSGSADMLAWRATPPTNPRACNSVPPWFPLDEQERAPFDIHGDTPDVDPFPIGESQSLIGLATQLFPTPEIDVLLLDPLPLAGSARMNFATVLPGGFMPEGQSLVGVMQATQGRFSELHPARALDSGCTAGTVVPARVSGPVQENPAPPSYIFRDGFSS